MSTIRMRGLRTHNLKNIDVDIPRNQLVVITGISGSGKSSLAFDTLYAEGQRRYVESLSTYARQFLSVMAKPDVDSIEGLSPAIAIEQKSASHNPRSTVGTITEIYDYLRLLYARVGSPRCPTHGTALAAQTVSQMVDVVMALPEGTAVMILSPVVQARKGQHQKILDRLRGEGFIRVRVDGEIYELDEVPNLSLRKKHTIEVVVDRLKVRAEQQQRVAESFETALNLSGGLVIVSLMDSHLRKGEGSGKDQVFSAKFACPECGYSLEELEPRLFSFNSPVGACPTCDGLGQQEFFDPGKVVHNPALGLAGGAIRGWDRNNFYYYQLLLSISKHYHFDIETPWNQLPDNMHKVILYGEDNEKITFSYTGTDNKTITRKDVFEGVLPNMERRYDETKSMAVREELAKYLSISHCEACEGTRLCVEARHVWVNNKTLPEVTQLSIEKALAFFDAVKLPGKRGKIADKILREICVRLTFLNNVGLNYLTLERSAETLSGGEAQRIRLASQIGSGLMGVMYVLDEPSIGLHQSDNERLIKTLHHLRDLGNSVIVVEHDEETMMQADYIIDIGPGAGVNGGKIMAEGIPSAIVDNPDSLTGQYLSGKESIPVPRKRLQNSCRQQLRIKGACCNNLKAINVDIPLGLMTCITGVSGSGKSSLINDTLYPIAAHQLNKAGLHQAIKHKRIEGLEYCDKVVDINQSPIGRTPRSNPATYTGLFTLVRDLFAGTQESRSRGYKVGRFSFNVRGGRCESCEGDGVMKVEMHFLADVYVMCDICRGKRYNRETLGVQYKGKNIHQVLSMTVAEAREFFEAVPSVSRKLQTLMEVGLSYITLGQSATTLSGGEAQRIKLSKELSRRGTGKTLYILDEPTTGLHFHDIKQLLSVLMCLRDQGNTIVVIEHNMDIIKMSDWIIDLGPGGGDAGGEVVAFGTPENLTKNKASLTGQFLKRYLKQRV